MVDRANVTLIAREAIQHVNHTAVNLMMLDGAPQAIHAGAIEIFASLDFMVDMRLGHVPAKFGGVCD